MGQWQKIARGRTFISESDLYIFDEPNVLIDLVSENAILNVILENSRDKIKLVILHRFNKIIEKADSIITLNDGCITENGTHQELLKKRDLYYELHSLQEQIVTMNNSREQSGK